jgi:diketogulonate reductase-like aldo/keto reductase
MAFENPDGQEIKHLHHDKVWPHLSKPKDVEWSPRNSLEMLGTDDVDLFLIHWPFAVEKTENNTVVLNPNDKGRLRNEIYPIPLPTILYSAIESIITN